MGFFAPVPHDIDFRQLEAAMLTFWQEHDIFQQALRQRQEAAAEPWVLYEAPLSPSGLAHVGHVLPRIYKDLFARYQTMQGRAVWWHHGWNMHGLAVEVEAERELGLSGKTQITAYGVAAFNARCQALATRYMEQGRRLAQRVGVGGALERTYLSSSNEAIESVWAILKNFWDRNLLYQSYQVTPYCPRCGTPLADHEVVLGYEQTNSPSVYVKFPLRDEPGVYFLVWTTTPWTLLTNVALAVDPEGEYLRVRQGDDVLILAAARADAVLGAGTYHIEARFKGGALFDVFYQPLFRFFAFREEHPHFLVVEGDFVRLSEGSGIVHIAPAFGADDLDLARRYHFTVITPLDDQGRFLPQISPYAGLFFKEADADIVADLEQRGLIYQTDTHIHGAPFCWRCHTPLLPYGCLTWQLKTTRYHQDLITTNQEIDWNPSHIGPGRFGEWLGQSGDWVLGRDRPWGTPLPIWVCSNETCRHRECVGSKSELESRVGRGLGGLDLHRPGIDELTWDCPVCMAPMRRVPEVVDAWFDAGAMPYAQWHYPFENRELFSDHYPADWVCEASDQVRGWFYTLHVLSTLLFHRAAFDQALVLGHLLDEHGRKMSRRQGTRIDPWQIINLAGADALRWSLFTMHTWEQPSRFHVAQAHEVVRTFLGPLWQTYAHFVAAANRVGWSPEQVAEEVVLASNGEGTLFGDTLPNQVPVTPLDRWLLSEMHQLVLLVDERLTHYDAPGATQAIATFVANLSEWYLRRASPRLLAGEREVFATLYTVLVTLSQVLAPFVPFVAEAIYRNLVPRVDSGAPISVHLTDFPIPHRGQIDQNLHHTMALVQQITKLGQAARTKAGFPPYQPVEVLAIASESSEPALADEDGVAFALLQQELFDALKVRRVELVPRKALLRHQITLNLARLDPRLGQRLAALRTALADLEQSAKGQALLAGQAIVVEVAGELFMLTPEEVSITIHDRSNYAVVSEGPLTVAVTTTLSEALRDEGHAQALIYHWKLLRREGGLQPHERIVAWVEGDIDTLIEAWGDTIQTEINAIAMHRAAPPPEAKQTKVVVGRWDATIGLQGITK